MDTIKSNCDISRIFSNGKRVSNRYLTIIYTKRNHLNEGDSSLEHGHSGRVAFIAGKKHGGAVWRNAAKRRLRELYRLGDRDLEEFDVLLIAKSSIMKSPFSDVLNGYNDTVKRLVG